jgi:hypothetical protein
MFAMGVHCMKVTRRCGFFRLWLVGTLILLIGAGLVLRPDRDAAQYLGLQHLEVDESDLQTRQLVTHIRHLRREGLALDQIKGGLLSSAAFSNEIVDRMIEFETALGAKEQAEGQLTLFAAIALAPPLLILELGAALLWARRSYRAWVKALCVGRGRIALRSLKHLAWLLRQAPAKQV